METIYIYQRPVMLSAAVAPMSAAPLALAVAWPSGSQAHRVEAQVELLLVPAPNGIEGTSGFPGKGVDAAKRRTDVRGVPPRGRPV